MCDKTHYLVEKKELDKLEASLRESKIATEKVSSLLAQLSSIPKQHLDHKEKKRRKERESKLSREHSSLASELEQLTRETHEIIGGKFFADVVSETEMDDDDEEEDDTVERLQKGNQQYQQQQLLLQQQEAMGYQINHISKLAVQRHVEIQKIEQQTRATYDMMKDLREMVGEQASTIDILEANVGQTLDNVKTSLAHITKEIGRAVQQECRDRSRMPSSA
eukprot:TRINITY_DN11317_c0_g1_i12.p1 TRINITY_DN11317_c0_g1~~TRINITY_DN11317_c0_g1_i12.p1  ORF type:complete len:221 (-),score=36.55 TRINITY_DN11317_c0_g1_i12:11-673(-)